MAQFFQFQEHPHFSKVQVAARGMFSAKTLLLKPTLEF
ncbi:MAG: hypothetical protein ACJA1B_001745 [Polaribacter sp.]|jgi:hypothetical protein